MAAGTARSTSTVYGCNSGEEDRVKLRRRPQGIGRKSMWREAVAALPHGGHLDVTADGTIKWKAHRRTRRWGGSCPELA